MKFKPNKNCYYTFFIKILFFVIIACLIFAGCEKQPIEYEKSTMLMGTFCSIKIVDSTKKEIEILNDIDSAFSVIRGLENNFSIYKKDNEIDKFNLAPAQVPIAVSDDFYSMLKLSAQIYSLSLHTFDITVYPIVKLWGIYKKDRTKLPSSEEITSTLSQIGMDSIVIDEKKHEAIKLKEIKIDLGGIGKGFAVDKARYFLNSKGYNNYIIDLGGNLYVAGYKDPKNQKKWQVGIKDPEQNKSIIGYFEAYNQGISTSGAYNNYIEIEGKKYSHIVDPRTGYPINQFFSTTVIAKDAGFADGLSTAFQILKIDEIQKISEQFNDVTTIIFEKQDNNKVNRHIIGKPIKINDYNPNQ